MAVTMEEHACTAQPNAAYCTTGDRATREQVQGTGASEQQLLEVYDNDGLVALPNAAYDNTGQPLHII